MTEKKMKSVNIKGKDYIEVNERVKYFRNSEEYKGWSIESEMISNEDGVCVFKSIIRDENGVTKATGHAYEKEDGSFINKTSYIENCETSAVGRALGFLGIGIDTSIASSDEVQNAMLNQDNDFTRADYPPTEKQLNYIQSLLSQRKVPATQIDEQLAKVKTSKQAKAIIDKLKGDK